MTVALIVIGCVFGYAQVGFIAGGFIYRHFWKVNHKNHYHRKPTEDQLIAAWLGGIFWPIGGPAGLGFLFFRWEYQTLTNKRTKKPKRAKRRPLHLRHRKVPDHEAIAQLEKELEIEP